MVTDTQTFTVTPDDEATLTVSTDTGANANRGARQYSVSNPVADTEHTIALIPADNVTIDDDGVVTFADELGGTEANPGDDTADELGDDAELFGVGGATTWLPAEAATFSGDNGVVVEVGDGFYTLDTSGNELADVLVNFGSGESSSYTSGSTGLDGDDNPISRNINISAAQFGAWLSGPVADDDFSAVGDSVTFANYNPGAGASHVLTNDVPNQVSGVSAAYSARNNAVTISWDDVTNPDVVNYVVAGALFDTSDDEFGDYDIQIDVEPGEEEVVVSNPAAGDHRWVVVAENDEGQNGPISATAEVTVPVGADTTEPTIAAISFSDTGADGTGAGTEILDLGDQVALTFSERVVVENGVAIEFTDNDGTVGSIALGGNASFTQSTNGRVVFITLTANPTLDTPGATLALDELVNITDVDTIEDPAGNELDLDASETQVFDFTDE